MSVSCRTGDSDAYGQVDEGLPFLSNTLPTLDRHTYAETVTFAASTSASASASASVPVPVSVREQYAGFPEALTTHSGAVSVSESVSMPVSVVSESNEAHKVSRYLKYVCPKHIDSDPVVVDSSIVTNTHTHTDTDTDTDTDTGIVTDTVCAASIVGYHPLTSSTQVTSSAATYSSSHDVTASTHGAQPVSTDAADTVTSESLSPGPTSCTVDEHDSTYDGNISDTATATYDYIHTTDGSTSTRLFDVLPALFDELISSSPSPSTSTSTYQSDSYIIPDLPTEVERKRDFNKEFQRVFERPAAVYDKKESSKRLADLQHVYADFVDFSKRVGIRLIRELHLPSEQRTPGLQLPSTTKGGRAGGAKFVYGRVMFKFAHDVHHLYGSDEYAAKAASCEVRNMGAILKAIHEGDLDQECYLNTTLTVLVMAGGHVVYATALAPISGNTTLVYGSSDAGRTVHKSEFVASQMAPLATYFGLADHRLRDHSAGLQVCTGVDVEVHASFNHVSDSSNSGMTDCDGRLYLLDLARFLPCTPPRADAPREFLYHMFRPEFAREWSGLVQSGHTVRVVRPDGSTSDAAVHPLSSDVYSYFQHAEEMETRAAHVSAAYCYLTDTVVSRVCTKLIQLISSDTDSTQNEHVVVLSSDTIRDVFHSNGLNMRYLWLVYNQLYRQGGQSSLCDQVLQEMICRSVKQLVRFGLRRCTSLSSEHILLSSIIQCMSGKGTIPRELAFSVRDAIVRMCQIKYCGYHCRQDVSTAEDRKLLSDVVSLKLHCEPDGCGEMLLSRLGITLFGVASPTNAHHLLQTAEKVKTVSTPDMLGAKYRRSWDVNDTDHKDHDAIVLPNRVLEYLEQRLFGLLRVKVVVCGGDKHHVSLLPTLCDLAQLYSSWYVDDTSSPSPSRRDNFASIAQQCHRIICHTVHVIDRSEPHTVSYDTRTDILNELSQVYTNQGKYDRALELYEHTLKIKEATLGSGHSSTAITLSNMAAMYKNQGDDDRALQLYERALKIKETSLGADHPEAALTLSNIAHVFKRQGEYDRALEFFTRALAIKQTSLGNDHPEVAITLSNTAQVYQRQGKHDQALELHEHALTIKQTTLGDEHPEVAIALNNMASVYKSRRDYRQALELHTRALAIYEASLGSQHPSTAIALHHVADLHLRQRHYDQALELYERALKIKQAALGDEHVETAITLSHMAGVYKSQRDYTRALELYERALQIKQATLGEDHPEAAMTVNNMAQVCDRQGDYVRALELYASALKMKESTLGSEHPEVAITLSNMARVCDRQDDYSQAIQLHERALKIYQVTLGLEHTKTKRCMFSIEYCRSHL
jgi:tetratricopeptide (TPR) repeat protein